MVQWTIHLPYFRYSTAESQMHNLLLPVISNLKQSLNLHSCLSCWIVLYNVMPQFAESLAVLPECSVLLLDSYFYLDIYLNSILRRKTGVISGPLYHYKTIIPTRQYFFF